MQHFLTCSFIFLITFLLTSCGQPESAADETAFAPDGSMLQHTVYFYLNDDVTSDEKAEFEDGLRELMQIESIHTYELGQPAATEQREVTDHAFAYSIFSWFETIEDYENYADHPVHLDFIDQYSELWSDVKVYDSVVFERNR